jgi:hypothetical protein
MVTQTLERKRTKLYFAKIEIIKWGYRIKVVYKTFNLAMASSILPIPIINKKIK